MSETRDETKNNDDMVLLPNGVNLRVIKEAYAWDYHTDTGELHGLTAGDQGYEPTGIIIETLTPQWKAKYPDWLEYHTPSQIGSGNQNTSAERASATRRSAAQKSSLDPTTLSAVEAEARRRASLLPTSHDDHRYFAGELQALNELADWCRQQRLGDQLRPSKAWENCGYALYGPPALCTCGTCEVGCRQQRETQG